MIKSFLKSERGLAALEAAFIFPFMVLLYFGLNDLTAMITFNRKITATAAAIGDTIAQYPTTITRANIADIFNAVGMVMQPTPDTAVQVNVFGYYLKNGVPTQRWHASNGNGPTCTAPDTTNYVNLMSGSNNDLVVSVACFSYTPYVASFFGNAILGHTNFLLNQTITSRPRASSTLNCITVAGGTTSCAG